MEELPSHSPYTFWLQARALIKQGHIAVLKSLRGLRSFLPKCTVSCVPPKKLSRLVYIYNLAHNIT